MLYEENIQIDGRISRIYSILPSSLPESEANKSRAREISIHFLLPRKTAEMRYNMKDVSDEIINCYQLSYMYLQRYSDYYNTLFTVLKQSSFLEELISIRLEETVLRNIEQNVSKLVRK